MAATTPFLRERNMTEDEVKELREYFDGKFEAMEKRAARVYRRCI
jgi:hypothetical protein